jgi:hypothetical protein
VCACSFYMTQRFAAATNFDANLMALMNKLQQQQQWSGYMDNVKMPTSSSAQCDSEQRSLTNSPPSGGTHQISPIGARPTTQSTDEVSLQCACARIHFLVVTYRSVALEQSTESQ